MPSRRDAPASVTEQPPGDTGKASSPGQGATVWGVGTLLLCGVSFAVAVGFAPAASEPPAGGLLWLLFVGSSVHVAATAWFYSRPEVRAYARSRPGRYILVPLLLVIGTGVLAALVPPRTMSWLLPGYFAWQFLHFQKQNLGMVALAGACGGAGRVTRPERTAITMTGVTGTAGLLTHPELLQIGITLPHAVRALFPIAASAFGVMVVCGLVVLFRRPAARRPALFTSMYLLSLGFFLPVFLFTSPYAAVAGLTMAHGFQYLMILGLVAGARRPSRRSAAVSLAVLVNLALLGGLLLNVASHLHGSDAWGRSLYGAALGAVMAHFVIDAGLWRLRDAFPRNFLSERVPYLIRGR
jgi:hypothetical protein